MIEFAKVGTCKYRVLVDGEYAGAVYLDPEDGTWTASDRFAFDPQTGFHDRYEAAEWLVP